VNPFRIEFIARAIAAWERTLTPFDSPYDRWVFEDDREALSAGARAGAALFASDRLGCAECHRGLLFGAADPWSARDEVAAKSADRGSIGASGSVVTATIFRVPSLRNVALTAPYMHDGRFATLGEVLDYYARGGGHGAIDGDREDGGAPASAVRGFELSAEERQSLLAFLEGLSDEVFVSDDEERRVSGARSGVLAD
jgi:cytochrome c peroxidase